MNKQSSLIVSYFVQCSLKKKVIEMIELYDKSVYSSVDSIVYVFFCRIVGWGQKLRPDHNSVTRKVSNSNIGKSQ